MMYDLFEIYLCKMYIVQYISTLGRTNANINETLKM